MTKFRILDEVNMDKERVTPNPIWQQIQNYILKSFGKLANIVWGEIRNDEYLIDAYIKEFNIEKDRKKLLSQFDRDTINNKDRRFVQFAHKHLNYVYVHILRSYHDLNINEWIENKSEVLITLLGDRGTGKSTFIAYLAKNLPEDVVVFIVNLGNIKDNQDVKNEMYQSLVKQIDDKVRKIGRKYRLTNSAIYEKRFYDDLSDLDAIINERDNKEIKIEKERRKTNYNNSIIKAKTKYDKDVIKYLLSGVDFIKSFNLKVCVIFDDADRLKDFDSAEEVRREAHEIMETLKLPVILSLREITTKKMGNRFERQYQYHILPPSFRDLLERRSEIITREINKSSIKDITIKTKNIGKNEYISFIDTIKDSIVYKEENLFMFYMLSNSNIDLMLDFFRTILSSPHFTNEELIKIISENKINQHKILEALLKNIYSEYYSSNTFILNLYDCHEVEEIKDLNNLFRIRILEIIREFGYQNEENKKLITYNDLINYLDDLGYIGNFIVVNLQSTMILFRDYGLIDASIFGNDFEGNTEFSLKDSAYFYLDHLIFTYRYVETIIPDTQLDYPASRFDLKSDLKTIDKELNLFFEFISRSENYERKNLKVKETLSRLEERGRISEKLKKGVAKDREKQMHKI